MVYRPEPASSRLAPPPTGARLADSALLARLVLYGFLLRAFLAIILDWTGYSLRLAPDEETYSTNGWLMALYWRDELLMPPWWTTTSQPQGYFYINAVCFYVFGNTVIPIKLINAFIGAFAVRYLYYLTLHLFGPLVARRAAILFEFLPSLILWSVLNIRDVWVVTLILYVSWKSLQVVQGYSHTALVTGIAATGILTLFRDYLFYVIALPPLAALLIGRRGQVGRSFVLALIGGFLVLFLVHQVGVGDTAVERMSLEAISKVRQDMATGGSSFHENVDVSTPFKALMFLPIGVGYFLFSPFPWQITSPLKLLSVPEMLLIYGLVPAMVRGIRQTVRHHFRESLQILLLTTLLTTSYALGEGNVGTLYRHRAQAIGFYLVFAALGLELARDRRAPAQRAGAWTPAVARR